MTVIYGTKNPAKLSVMKKYVQALDVKGFDVIGLEEAGYGTIYEPDESGNSPLENAWIKAQAYYDIIKKPVFSADSGLYFPEIPEELQPGVNVRRVNGVRLDDDGMIEYYSGLAARFGGKIKAVYRNGICLVTQNRTYKHDGDDIAYEGFYLSAVPRKQRVAGFPLDALSIHIASGQYYYDREISKSERLSSSLDEGFCRFFDNVGKQENWWH